MPTHAEQRILPYSQEQLFNLVADIESYPQFLPWCVALRIKSRKQNILNADMMIGFKVFREKFTTKVILSPPGRVDVSYENGPFKYLNNHWIFIPQEGGSCMIDFYVDFEFRSKILQSAIGLVFNEAVQKMINSFEERANSLYQNESV